MSGLLKEIPNALRGGGGNHQGRSIRYFLHRDPFCFLLFGDHVANGVPDASPLARTSNPPGGNKQNMIHTRDTITFYTPKHWFTFLGAGIIMLSTAGFAGASPITAFGSAILEAGNGSVVVSGNGTTGGCIIWYNSGSPPNVCPTSGTGNLSVEGGSTAPFTAGTMGTIDNLNFNTPLPLVDFMVINNSPNTPGTLQFDLQDIRFNGASPIGGCSGPAALSPGDTCTPANSPFQLTNGLADPTSGLVDTVSVALTVDAWGYTGSSGINYNAADAYIGTFTTQQAIQGATIQSILDTIAGGGSVNASWSATFTPQVAAVAPEPRSMFLMLGAGLMALGLFKRNARNS
jgi:hypothetical protein